MLCYYLTSQGLNHLASVFTTKQSLSIFLFWNQVFYFHAHDIEIYNVPLPQFKTLYKGHPRSRKFYLKKFQLILELKNLLKLYVVLKVPRVISSLDLLLE